MLAAISSVFNQDPLIFIIISVVLVFLAWNIVLQIQIHRTGKRLKAIFKGARAADLEGVIFEQIKRQRQTEKNLKELENFCQYLEKMGLNSMQKTGVIRFNPFKDTGGDQSFCIACLNAQNSGFTLSGLFTREGTRIYTKPIVNGESKYPLTEEEKRAIEMAVKSVKSEKAAKAK